MASHHSLGVFGSKLSPCVESPPRSPISVSNRQPLPQPELSVSSTRAPSAKGVHIPDIMTSKEDSLSPHRPAKPVRVLACVLCQQRKVKCNREFPCTNCIKARAQCVPATQLARRRRRRLPENDLLGRLRHYEELLNKNDIPFEPIGEDCASQALEGEGEDGVVGITTMQEPESHQSETVFETKYAL
jgi:hypothetical protein